MAKQMRKMLVLANLENSPGADGKPNGNAHAMLVRNVTISPAVAEYADRAVIRPYMGASEQIPTAIRTEVNFEVELAGSGDPAKPPKWGPLIQACGFSETLMGTDKPESPKSTVYRLVSDGMKTITLYCYVDGLFQPVTSVRGTATLNLTTKEIPVIQFKFTGFYGEVADRPLPSPVDYSGFRTPLAVNHRNTSNWQFQGATSPLQALTIDLGNTVVHDTLVGQESVDITDRKVVGTASIELGTVGQKNWWTAARDAVTGPLTITHGKAAGNTVVIAAPKVQASNLSYTNQNNNLMLDANLTFVPDHGNDELTITVT
ncbi:MAG: phage tail tube protein [Janthinobacterium lividum]